MENGNPSQGEGKDPSSFLSDIIGNPVTVKLNSGVVYKGECYGFKWAKEAPPALWSWGLSLAWRETETD